MITVKNLTKSFGTRTLWRNLNLTVPAGRMLALVGASGSGKTTLLNCIGLLERPSSGHILFDNTDLTRLGPGGRRRFRRDKLGYLFQDYALIDNATVKANLDVARRRGTRPDYARILERVGLAGRENEKVHYLSGGEQQRVALARLMVKQPTLVLADEPTGALDSANSAMVVNVLREMSEQGCAVVIATHNDGVRDACDLVFDVHEQREL
ncbi:ABC transporter ATP-binding protein [Thermobifida fusca]|mgnify:CR=1 FL=1|jgi:putative ABC transport system ATP-binding protein|uniref:Peptide ABC transporter ATPase n=2 Tax=Thermobifida fusca TaxID=2021 RepID=A0A9P2TD55_THEFU|nr:ATP-binding cassette domain-containing protein [Thermobifida fusca]AAZ54850.1 ABC-type antimicrobial peptide transport system ATPase component [Thermobifida fusca YX]EOR72111.1 peptide ABC transporter ATPase [Thermobifida fusca TM51]MDD6791769.1 ATP-binding cassette domain-containing protein [Thermobifida fusca]PPS96576.1 peptide ABC transporter ATPase [Thermobifida fusca]PZN64879.1 MAG: lipoprotein ABC transporter ATP-binding protein [Thermobifida fusca]